MDLVLASGSPRRRDVLAALGLEFEVRVPAIEEVVGAGETAEATVVRLAREKVVSVQAGAGELVLAADTVVRFEGDVLGKPADGTAATAMLMRLAGRTHEVFTGIALTLDGRCRTALARTEVTFRPFGRAECSLYVATGEPLDKAGSYGIQGFGAALVERIDGDYFNVMGLPVPAFLDLLGDMGCRYTYGGITKPDGHP